MASTMASTVALSRPSEKLGTHSTSVLGMARSITGGGWVRQLRRECTVMRWSDGRLAREDSGWRPGDPPARLTQCSSNRQTTKLCGAHLDSPAAVLLDDSPAQNVRRPFPAH